VGYGGGYYDRFLPELRAVRSGLASPFPASLSIRSGGAHDVPVDFIVTETEIIATDRPLTGVTERLCHDEADRQRKPDKQDRKRPRSPGVYLMRDRDGKVIYAGKALDLKSRVRSYFGGTDGRFMVPFLVSRIADIEFIVTETEKEALILENNLIKVHRPVITSISAMTRPISISASTRRIPTPLRAGPPARQRRRTLLRTLPSSAAPRKPSGSSSPSFRCAPAATGTAASQQTLSGARDRPLQRPCVGRIDAETYQGLVRDALAFLDGRERTLLSNLRSRMNAAATLLDFEEAAHLRDRIAAIEPPWRNSASSPCPAGTVTPSASTGRATSPRSAPSMYARASCWAIGSSSDPDRRRLRRHPLFAPQAILRRRDLHSDEIYLPEPSKRAPSSNSGSRIGEESAFRSGRRAGARPGIVEMAARNAENVFTTQRRHEQGPKKPSISWPESSN